MCFYCSFVNLHLSISLVHHFYSKDLVYFNPVAAFSGMVFGSYCEFGKRGSLCERSFG
uniref:Uncharacterized protein n=1 Tax=Rhizophora mucronata TaxID=61149 RepID=A0A2P2JJD7_RHIMU